MRRSLELRFKPSYLHPPNPAPDTAHMRVSLERGRELVAALRGSVSGLAQPAYVLDIPGGHGKVPVSRDHLEGDRVRDHAGRLHAYPEQAARKPDLQS